MSGARRRLGVGPRALICRLSRYPSAGGVAASASRTLGRPSDRPRGPGGLRRVDALVSNYLARRLPHIAEGLGAGPNARAQYAPPDEAHRLALDRRPASGGGEVRLQLAGGNDEAVLALEHDVGVLPAIRAASACPNA